ncbi:dehydration-responsive element-binding protein 1B [Beta vulgaris subsp. vulgaris]|uniref:dehydration-responsive element-binding protein 1B n=1 Tax=Beta vulgaris subsp. vulgaris TaxID=3555 RepID=UPI0020368C61|nr:dehydration-responsive element-binding protein 1B [Beta vulgaris subsp. vulgaris]
MNTLNSLSILPDSPLLSGGESEDIVSPDSPTNWTTSPFTNSLNGEVAGLPQKRKTGRKKFKETRHPFYHGVRERDGGKWVSEIREPNKKSRIWLGTYPAPELAARAHDVAALALKGDKAALNFPDSAWLVSRAKSTSARDIRLAAFQATRSELHSSLITTRDNETEAANVKYMENSGEELFVDEEVIFNMPSFIDGMAQGMLLTPPSLKREINWDGIDDCGNITYIHLDLW